MVCLSNYLKSRKLPIPCQMAHLDWASTVDFDPAQSTRTRENLFSRLAGTDTLVIGAHFSAGRVVRDGTAFSLVV
jgi:hypothetical protein